MGAPPADEDGPRTSPGELGAAVTGGTIVTGGDIQIEKMNTARVLVTDRANASRTVFTSAGLELEARKS